MKYIGQAESRRFKHGLVKFSKFLCPKCDEVVERRHFDGVRYKTCGCFFHGDRIKNTRLYTIWSGIKNRCNNPKNDSFKWYGGKGVKLCDEWSDYPPFKKWALNSGYLDDLQIDRIDNNKNYDPSNCQFITCVENIRKKDDTKLKPENVMLIKKILSGTDINDFNISTMFGVTAGCISSIRIGRSWNDIEFTEKCCEPFQSCEKCKTEWKPISEMKKINKDYWLLDQNNIIGVGYVEEDTELIRYVYSKTPENFGTPVMFTEIKPPKTP